MQCYVCNKPIDSNEYVSDFYYFGRTVSMCEACSKEHLRWYRWSGIWSGDLCSCWDL